MNLHIATTLSGAFTPNTPKTDGVTALITPLTCTCDMCNRRSEPGRAMFILHSYNHLMLCDQCADDFQVADKFDLRQIAVVKQLCGALIKNPTNQATEEPTEAAA